MIIVKIHQANKRKIVSLCDANLIGKKFEDGNLQLDVSNFFYNGEKLNKKEILNAVKDADSLNIVGIESIKFSLKNHFRTNQLPPFVPSMTSTAPARTTRSSTSSSQATACP